jgi:SulP family sulfate permease
VGTAAVTPPDLRAWWARIRPSRADLRHDAVASVPGTVAAIPDSMASGLLANVSPVHGLYAAFAGHLVGGLTATTPLMVITTTSAAALAAGSALSGLHGADRADSFALLTLVAGVAMLVAGLAKLGRYTRFVSHSVMTGFLSGVAVNIVCSQVPDLLGAPAEGSFPLAKAVDVLVHPSRIDPASAAVGGAALALLVVLGRTRLGPFGALLALAIPTAAVILLGADGVKTVSDIGDVPTGLPIPGVPRLSLLTPSLLTGALAVTAIVLVQGAGVSESIPRREGTGPDPDGDFVAQGAGNVAAGLLSGLPVGGSVGQSAVNLAAGGRTRWSIIWSGVGVAIVLLALSGLVGRVAMPTLAAVLVVAAVGSLRVNQLRTILRTSQIARVVVVTTFLATLLLTVPAAVAIGVALSLLLQLNREALDLTVVRLVPDDPDHPTGWVEEAVPTHLASHEVVVLDVYGSLFYAGARTLQTKLPAVDGATAPVVVLRLRGRTLISATAQAVLRDYATRLAARGGRLYLSGLDRGAADQVRESRALDLDGPVRIFPATPRLGASTAEAYEAAEAWEVSARSTGDQAGDEAGGGGSGTTHAG